MEVATQGRVPHDPHRDLGSFPPNKCPPRNGGILTTNCSALSRLTERLIPLVHSFSDGVPTEVAQRPPSTRATHCLPAGIVLEQHQKRLGQLRSIIFLDQVSRLPIYHGLHHRARTARHHG